MAGPEANAPIGSFVATAAAGGFAVSPQVGKAMTDAIDKALDELMEATRLLHRVKMGTPLGDSPAGRVIAEHNLSVAAGADNTGERALRDLRLALEEHRAAIDQAVAHYREQEHSTTGIFR